MRPARAAVAFVLATPVAAWSVAGDLSETQFDDLDYMWRPPDLPAVVEVGAGVVSVGMVLAASVFLGLAVRRGEVRRQWWATVVPLVVAGVVLGAGGRVVTAGGIGADVGGGLVIFFGVPLVAALVVAATWNAWFESRR